jgi:hypothetical protein
MDKEREEEIMAKRRSTWWRGGSREAAKAGGGAAASLCSRPSRLRVSPGVDGRVLRQQVASSAMSGHARLSPHSRDG